MNTHNCRKERKKNTMSVSQEDDTLYCLNVCLCVVLDIPPKESLFPPNLSLKCQEGRKKRRLLWSISLFWVFCARLSLSSFCLIPSPILSRRDQTMWMQRTPNYHRYTHIHKTRKGPQTLVLLSSPLEERKRTRFPET